MLLYFTPPQVSGIDDLYVFDDGEVHVDTNGSIGETQAKAEISLQTLHVQDRGTVKLHTFDKTNTFALSAINVSVSISLIHSRSSIAYEFSLLLQYMDSNAQFCRVWPIFV